MRYVPYDPDAPLPRFRETAKSAKTDEDQGFVLYYTNQCPYTDKYAPLIRDMAQERSLPFRLMKLESAEEAQACPAPFTTYSLFYNGSFVTQEILSEKKFSDLLAKL